MLLINTSTDRPLYEQTTRLDGRDFLLRFDWNGRQQSYALSVGLADGPVWIVHGIKVVTATLLTAHYADRRLFPGDLTVITSGADDSPPRFGELGRDQRCQMYYIEAADIDRAGDMYRFRPITFDKFRDAVRVWDRPFFPRSAAL